MPQINITTQATVTVPPNVSTLILAENINARYRRVEMMSHGVVFISIDGSPAAVGKGIPMSPLVSRLVEWQSDLPAGDIPNMNIFAFTIHTARPVRVSVIEGE